MKIKTPFWWFILGATAMVLATKSGWALLGAWALARFAQNLAEQLSTSIQLHKADGSL